MAKEILEEQSWLTVGQVEELKALVREAMPDIFVYGCMHPDNAERLADWTKRAQEATK
jgi:hypothetical protein